MTDKCKENFINNNTIYIHGIFDNMKDDNFFIPAQECIKYGLADKILNID